MPRKKVETEVRHTAFGSKIDDRISRELKLLSVHLDKPIYLMVEEALWIYINRKKNILRKKETV